MKHPPLDRLESYASTETDVTARLLMEAHLAFCATCSTTVAKCRRPGDGMPDATLDDRFHVPPFERVWAAVRHQKSVRQRAVPTVLPAALVAMLPASYAVRWMTIAWPALVRVALLIRDADTGSALYMCRFAPWSTFPRHCHVGLEENVILAGRYRSGEVCADVGDWVVSAPGTEETARAEDEGCWCLSRVEAPGVRFTGWRRWIAALVSPGSSRP